MKISYTLILIVVIVVLIGGLVFYSFKGQAQTMQVQNSGNKANPVKFTDSRYYRKSYLISGDSLDPSAQQALAGFQLMKNTLPDGSMNITLKALSSEYSDQNYIVKPGQKLYFIETSDNDDSYPNGESSLRDDHAILVDSNGYIVNN